MRGKIVKHDLDGLYDRFMDKVQSDLSIFANNVLSDVRASNDYKGSKVKGEFRFTPISKTGIRFWNSNSIAYWLEYGTKPRWIAPVRSEAMSFGGGFSKGHRHPGNKPYGVLGKAILANLPNLIRRIENG